MLEALDGVTLAISVKVLPIFTVKSVAFKEIPVTGTCGVRILLAKFVPIIDPYPLLPTIE